MSRAKTNGKFNKYLQEQTNKHKQNRQIQVGALLFAVW